MIAGWWYISMEPCYPCWFVCPETRKYAIALVLEHIRYFMIDTDINFEAVLSVDFGRNVIPFACYPHRITSAFHAW